VPEAHLRSCFARPAVKVAAGQADANGVESSGTRPLLASAEAQLPRWDVWFIATVMSVFTAIFVGLAISFWIRSPQTRSHVLGAAMFAIPFLAAWYLDRACPRRASATPDGLR
jgi:hypothetical protein